MRKVLAASALLLVFACASGQVFTKLSSYDAPLPGRCTLLFYSGVYQARYGALVIMFPEKSAYSFLPYYPSYGWKTVPGVPGGSAMKEAGDMLGVKDIRRLRVQAIMHGGKAIGYQASPPTEPPDNSSYYFEISYFLRGNTVRVQVLPFPFYHGY
ncbi:MAG: hypothetical protein M0Z48_10720 [Nitrospiraceae bacterium]|nr:hypothetical protein [Nitrospiraceae bacterium]